MSEGCVRGPLNGSYFPFLYVPILFISPSSLPGCRIWHGAPSTLPSDGGRGQSQALNYNSSINL